MVTRKLALLAMATAAWTGVASATVVSSLPGGVALNIPAVNLTTAGAETLASGVTYTSDLSSSVYGNTDFYGFATNGSWIGTPMIGLNETDGSFQLAFANPISGFLGDLNWTEDQTDGNATIAIYNASGLLLESLTLENTVNLVDPGYWGFSRNLADISYVRFSNEFIGVRDITIAGPVPEPAAWAMLIAGFGMVGLAARRRRIAVSA